MEVIQLAMPCTQRGETADFLMYNTDGAFELFNLVQMIWHTPRYA